MDIAQLTTDIERIKRMFSAILRYASRNKIHLPPVSSNAATHKCMGYKVVFQELWMLEDSKDIL